MVSRVILGLLRSPNEPSRYNDQFDQIDLGMLLEGFEFHPRVSVSDGEFVIRLPELNLIAGGTSYEDALGELVELAERQARGFFDRLDYYMQTDRRGQLGWLLKLALTASDERCALFFSPAPPAQTA